MAQIGSIGEYREKDEDFESYIARMKHYFVANDVPTVKQLSVLLTLIGPKGFALANNLLSPKSLDECKFDDVVTALTTHYKPKKILIFERYKFQTRNQKAGESIADYVAGIKTLAHTCDYKDNLDDMLRDRFVIGLSNRHTQQILLTEADLNFKKAVNVAVAREAALRDVDASHKSNSHEAESIHKVDYKKGDGRNNDRRGFKPKPNHYSPSNSKNKSHHNSEKPKTNCSGCGQLHWKESCPYKSYECHNCKRKGHLSKMCNTKKPSTYNIQHAGPSHRYRSRSPKHDEYDFVFNIHDSKVPPIVMDVILNNSKIQMEFDTGSFYSIMSKETFDKTWPVTSIVPVIKPFEGPLNVYGGSPLTTFGLITVDAKFNGITDNRAKIIIVNDRGPTLLGRGLMKTLKISNFQLTSDINQIDCKSLVDEFSQLFSPGLGCLKGKSVTIETDPNIPPKFCKARTVPYALREKVNKELDRLVAEKIIEPVTHCLWAAPMVPVLKSDNSIRVCGDYKITVNRAAHLDTYPIPKVQDLFANLAEGNIFSKLDMSQAYAQLCLDDASKPYTTINTPKGLFHYNRVPFGISSAPGIFQRAMEELLKDLQNVICYLDDILIVAADKIQHDKLLRQVFARLQTAGLKLKLEKCTIGVREVTYLGFRIDASGLHPTEDKLQAIKGAPRPKDVKQLRSYLGLLNFYRKFIPKASTILEPLNRLLKDNVPWSWDKDQEHAFSISKETLLKSEALIHFDPRKPIVVASDSSSYGIGAVLYHKVEDQEMPVCFVSRTLTSAERNYGQVEKEALAMVYAMKQFHNYLWGQHFTMVTDHKPLLGLFSPSKPIPPLASGRIQRWGLLLQAYNFDLVHRSGKLLCTADALSRLPLPNCTDFTPIPTDWTMLVNFLDWSPVTSANVKSETTKDPILSKLYKYCESGLWEPALKDPIFSPYVRRKDELSLQCGCILWGTRIIIPNKLRDDIKKELHSGHTGASRMKELARSYLWWPNLDKELENLCNSCPECLEKRGMPPKAELHPWEWPKAPWHRIHVDYAGPVDGNYFLIIVDAHSKWVEIFKTKGTTAQGTIKCLSHLFSQFGLPVSIVSDNGPCFTSQEYKTFLSNSGVRQILTAVYKPSTNGLAERMLQNTDL